MANNRYLAAIGRWGVLLPAVLVVGLGGLDKFIHPGFWRDEFVHWGYPAWMSPVTGVLEVGGAVAMLLPWTRFYGSVLVAGVMFSAFVTRIVHGEFVEAIVPFVVVGLSGLTAWWWRPAWVEARMGRS